MFLYIIYGLIYLYIHAFSLHPFRHFNGIRKLKRNGSHGHLGEPCTNLLHSSKQSWVGSKGV